MTKDRPGPGEQPTRVDGRAAVGAHPLDDSAEEDLRVGSKVGPYELVRHLGAGGMGTVFLAKQFEPVMRTVAIKVVQQRLSAGTDSWQYDQRLAAERQALARLSHPNVAQLYDSGETAAGQPYFAMEFVEGTSITEYCDRSALDLRRRLQLFLSVCRGVEHAHQNGVLHRDLKPANVLVGGGSEPSPKIIDFGIAKGMDEPLAAVTQLTQDGVVGTLAYLSPEAIHVAEGRSVLDTRADVFSLGILLHELLVGARPQSFTSENTASVLERILAADLPTPSAHWESLSPARRSQLAARRSTTEERILARLRGDLDWIVLRATEQSRDDRYPSVGELAADVERHLNDQPVEASPPSKAYRFRKFVRRNRAGVAAGAALALALVLGMIGTVAGFLQARAEQRVSEQQAQAARQAQQESDSVVDFMVDLFKAPSPGTERRDLEPVGEVLKRGADQLETSLEGQPAVRARLLVTVGEILKELGDYPTSIQLLEQAVQIRRDQSGGKSTEALQVALDTLGRSLIRGGDFAGAVPVLQEAADLERQLKGSDAIIGTNINLGNALRQLGRTEEALELRRELVSAYEAEAPEGDEDLARALAGLAQDLAAVGEREEAQATYRRSVDMARQHAPEDTVLLGMLLLNSASVHPTGSDVATGLLAESRQLLEKSLGPDHPTTLLVTYSLADQLRITKVDQAQELMLDILPRLEATLGFDHQSSITAGWALALTYFAQGNMETAADRFEEVLEKRRQSNSRNPAQRLEMETFLAEARCVQARMDDTRAALDAMEESLRRYDWERSIHGDSVEACYLLLAGRSEESAQLYRQAHRRFVEAGLDEDVFEGRILLGLGESLARFGQNAAAQEQYVLARAAFAKKLAEDHYWMIRVAAAERGSREAAGQRRRGEG